MYQTASNVTGFVSWLQYSNTVTSNAFGWVILLVWFIMATTISGNVSGDVKKGFVVGAFTTALFGILFRVMGLVGDFVTYFCIIGAIVAIAVSYSDY